MREHQDNIRSPCSQSSFAEKFSEQPETMMAREGIATIQRENTSPINDNINNLGTQQGSPNDSDSSFLARLGHHFKVDEELEFGGRSRKLGQQIFSQSLDALNGTPVSNDFEPTSWTVRNSEGYQEELLKHGYGSCDAPESDLGFITTTRESAQHSLHQGLDSKDDSILVHLILSFPEEVSDDVWKFIESSLKVSQSLTEQELMLPISRTSFLCYQRSEEIPNSDAKLAREISACITLKHYLHDTPTRYVFQLFLAIGEKQFGPNHVGCYWNKLNVVAFIQFPSTGQLLLPIEREVSRKEALCSSEGMFLGSFLMRDRKIYHHIPSESSLRRQESTQNSNCAYPMNSGKEEVLIVDRTDIVLEPNGARAGRPSHRETGQLLMTVSQVEKVLEIRNRWEGLSPRQRRDNVSNADFYTFLTLNRDETADCLGVCATWLKDAIRSQGVNVWPGRPLRRTGAMLQSLKESLESTKAAMRFSDPVIGEVNRYEADIQRYETEIRDLLAMRVEIVKANVSSEYFERFVRENGKQYLDPDWNALPPKAIHKHNL